jgi:hypothetical protein
MYDSNPEEVLLAVVNKVLDFANEGKQAKAQHILPFVYESVMNYPELLWNNVEVWKIAKALLIMHHYDLVEDEADELRMLQMALVFSERAIELCESNKETPQDVYFKALQVQVLLLSSCSDYYADTIVEMCSKTLLPAEERMMALRLANKIMPMLSYNVLVKVDDAFENFNGDAFLSNLCNEFELNNPDLEPKQLEDAKKIHKMLIHTYLKFFK